MNYDIIELYGKEGKVPSFQEKKGSLSSKFCIATEFTS